VKTRYISTLVFSLLLSACATAPFDYPREEEYAIAADTPTALKDSVDGWLAKHPGPSGFYPLVDGMSALGARIRLIERAEKSIDAQYFLMKADTAGHVFAGALLRAADRGVKVRFLLDDIFTTVEDVGLEVLNAHPNIEVRLFNPVSRRGIGFLNFIGDFRRANRRMHNKSFTVDNQVTIVGGRNIADEYFQLRQEGEFLDLDVMGMGPVAAEVSAVFDRFWNHERSLPLEAVTTKFSPEKIEAERQKSIREFETVSDSAYHEARSTPLILDLIEDRRQLYSAHADVVTDEPDKLVNAIEREHRVLVNHLAQVINDAEEEVLVITPYLVPGDDGLAYWTSIAARGVRVVILTNSLASNNHTPVHSAYSKYRKPLIEAGVELYETRANAVSPVGNEASELLTLHTKAIVVDRRHIFIGSLNLDPRSIDINSEMGLLIDSPELGAMLTDGADQRLGEIAYQLLLDERGRLEWHAVIDGAEVIETSEPLTSGLRRFMAFMLKIVPESQL
jgi:putative cardiolipin synthase